MNRSITFFTVSKNRINHLKNTLIQNINDNSDYKECVFLLLDYDSNDGTEAWVKENLKSYIDCAKLIYYRSVNNPFFLGSHSRNIAIRLSATEIVCNIDADNFTGKNFAQYVNSKFSENNNIFIRADTSGKFYPAKDVLGRLCFSKEHFTIINGYDESIKGYGFEDHDMSNRLSRAGLEKCIIEEVNFVKAISHDIEDRIANDPVLKNIESLYIRHIDPSSSEVIVLFKDHFERGTLIDNHIKDAHKIQNAYRESILCRYDILEEEWLLGDWVIDEGAITLNGKNQTSDKYLIENDSIKNDKYYFKKKTDPKIIQDYGFFHVDLTNRIKTLKNFEIPIVNKEGYGKGKVYKNFSKKCTILI